MYAKASCQTAVTVISLIFSPYTGLFTPVDNEPFSTVIVSHDRTLCPLQSVVSSASAALQEVMNSALSPHSESIPKFIHNASKATTLLHQPLTHNPHHPLSYSDSYYDYCSS